MAGPLNTTGAAQSVAQISRANIEQSIDETREERRAEAQAQTDQRIAESQAETQAIAEAAETERLNAERGENVDIQV